MHIEQCKFSLQSSSFQAGKDIIKKYFIFITNSGQEVTFIESGCVSDMDLFFEMSDSTSDIGKYLKSIYQATKMKGPPIFISNPFQVKGLEITRIVSL